MYRFSIKTRAPTISSNACWTHTYGSLRALQETVTLQVGVPHPPARLTHIHHLYPPWAGWKIYASENLFFLSPSSGRDHSLVLSSSAIWTNDAHLNCSSKSEG